MQKVYRVYQSREIDEISVVKQASPEYCLFIRSRTAIVRTAAAEPSTVIENADGSSESTEQRHRHPHIKHPDFGIRYLSESSPSALLRRLLHEVGWNTRAERIKTRRLGYACRPRDDRRWRVRIL